MIGPVGRVAIQNIERLRQKRGMSFRDLAAKMAELGRPIGDTVLHRQSQGKRRIDADDLLAFAAALDVNPSALLLPHEADGDDLVEITPALSVRQWIAWAWSDGETPLPEKDPGPLAPAELSDSAVAWFRENARPAFTLKGRDPLINEIEILLARVKMLARARSTPGPLAENQANWLEAYVRTQLERVKLTADELAARPPAALLSGEGKLGS